MHSIRIALALTLGTALISLPTPGMVVAQEQEAGHCPGRLEALDASYRQQLRAIERRWIVDLADLADKSSGPEANDAYRRLFNLAIARDLCVDAQPAAQSCLASIPLGEAEPAARTCSASIATVQDLRTLATSVEVFAHAERGEFEQSLADLTALMKRPGCGPQPAAKSDAATAVAVGDAYFERLVRSGRYDVARRLCELACEDDTPAGLKGHFEARMARLDMLDKPAPAISGTSVDGRQVSLADLKGKVVLVDFRESWCSHCVASSAALNALAQKYHRQGFVILGVNLDARHSDVKDGTTALPTPRQFLVSHGVTWIYPLDSQSKWNVTTGDGVEEVPANFLVSRDGRILAVEQSGDALERAIVRALGGLSGGLSRCSSAKIK